MNVGPCISTVNTLLIILVHSIKMTMHHPKSKSIPLFHIIIPVKVVKRIHDIQHGNNSDYK